MGQLNSGIGTKSCSYDFGQQGALGSGVFAFSGIALKPGEAIIDIRATKDLNMTSASGSGTTFTLALGYTAAPASGNIPLFTDTLANINLMGWNLNQSATLNAAFKIGFNWRWPATNTNDVLIFFTSSAALTAGKVNFLLTYALTKF